MGEGELILVIMFGFSRLIDVVKAKELLETFVSLPANNGNDRKLDIRCLLPVIMIMALLDATIDSVNFREVVENVSTKQRSSSRGNINAAICKNCRRKYTLVLPR